MEYSIHDLSQLSGLSTRTLRWYDEIGLLKPSRVAESGYRYYGPAQVDRLQEILIYRSLGVELARIRDCLTRPPLTGWPCCGSTWPRCMPKRTGWKPPLTWWQTPYTGKKGGSL